jgi:hypothetical protein
MQLADALRIARPLVTGKVKHKHYAHVVDLNDRLYRPMITGKNAAHLIARFNIRESEEAHKQRLRLTQLITPAISNTLIAPARKIPKVKPTVDSITFGADQKEADQKLMKAAAAFYAGKSVDHYFSSVLIDQGAIDPNAFCLVLRTSTEPKEVYPSIISCADAWNFEYFNGILRWLLVHRTIQYELGAAPAKPARGKAQEPVKPTTKEGHQFWLYTDNHHIVFRQVDPRTVSASLEDVLMDKGGKLVDTGAVVMTREGSYYMRVSQEELYEVVFYQHGTGMVQAFRLGYVPDQETKGETMVNLWHAAVPYMLKGIKSGSELDLSASLHAFLQKISFENPCRGYKHPDGRYTDCNDGWEAGGENKCKACGGSGMEVHTSGQDHITLRMPKDKAEAFDLANITHYVQLPVEVLEWQDKYVTKLEESCYRSVYNSDRFRNPSAGDTATGELIDLQSVYDTLKPGADWYSQSRILVYKLLASYTNGVEGMKKLEVRHEFPRNMRFETLSERIALMEKLRAAGASSSSIAGVNDSVLQDIYADDPRELKKAQVMASFDPFLGKTESTITTMISQDLTTLENKVLWVNMAYVFAEAEERAGLKMDEAGMPVDFYGMSRPEQQKMIDSIVAELIDAIEEQGATGDPRMDLGTEEGTDEGDGDAGTDDAASTGDETDDLPDSPGNDATA